MPGNIKCLIQGHIVSQSDTLHSQQQLQTGGKEGPVLYIVSTKRSPMRVPALVYSRLMFFTYLTCISDLGSFLISLSLQFLTVLEVPDRCHFWKYPERFKA